MTHHVLLLPGDGIGPEIMAEARKVLEVLRTEGLAITCETALIGGAAYEVCGHPLPDEVLDKAKAAHALLLGAVGGPCYEGLARPLRPEQGLLALRAALGLYANLRPVRLFPELAQASTLKSEVISGLDLVIVRELTGGLYFGQPRGIVCEDGERVGINTLRYRESEIERIARIAFTVALKRNRRLCSVDKANVLETSELWRETVNRVAQDFPQVSLSHLYVDNAAMQLIRDPRQFDVIVTENLFGDILSDEAAMLTGSIGMLPSASLNAAGQGLYEPIHGSAPDIAGRGIANPLATILSVALMLRYSLEQPDWANRVENAVAAVLERGSHTADLTGPSDRTVSTAQMGDAVVSEMRATR